MTEQKNRLAELFAACWADDGLKTRFVNDPKAVLAERDLTIPDGVDVKGVENADDCVYITLPASLHVESQISDEELSGAAAGGSLWNSCDRQSNCTMSEGWFC